jgi:hypothetical protein
VANQLAEQVEVDQFDTYTKFLALAQKHKNKTRFRAAIIEAGLDKYANEDSAFAGYFRVLDRDTELLVPLCLYYDEHGDLVILYRTEAEQENENAQVRLSHVWPWAMWSPISYDHWEAAYKGKGWWDQDAAIDELKKVGDWRATGGSPPIGDNQPPDEFKLDAEDPVSVQKWFDKLQAAPEQYTTHRQRREARKIAVAPV